MTHNLREFAADFIKLEHFDEVNFQCWPKQMHFLLANLKMMYVLTTPKSSTNEDKTIAQGRVMIKWVHICNSMFETLYNSYKYKAITKDMWDTLETKFLVEDAISKKFFATKFFSYNMVHSMFAVEQFNKIMYILAQFTQHNIKINESISVLFTIDTRPQSWKNYKRNLIYRR